MTIYDESGKWMLDSNKECQHLKNMQLRQYILKHIINNHIIIS